VDEGAGLLVNVELLVGPTGLIVGNRVSELVAVGPIWVGTGVEARDPHPMIHKEAIPSQRSVWRNSEFFIPLGYEQFVGVTQAHPV
jgi:hypothetical protein